MHCSSALFLGLLLTLVLSSHPQVKPITDTHNDTVYNTDQCQPVYKMLSNVAGSVDEQGNCICVFYLANKPIFLRQIEKLQIASEELLEKYELEFSKVDEHIRTIRPQKKTMLKHSQLLGWRQQVSGSESGSGHTSYSSADHWEALQWELLAAERLLTQVQNVSIILQHLANLQQDNLRTTLQEMSTLESQLNDYERYWSPGHRAQNLPPGSCAHGILLSVSCPLVVQLNWRDFGYKAGAWGRDTGLNLTSSLYWVAPLRSDGRSCNMPPLHPRLSLA